MSHYESCLLLPKVFFVANNSIFATDHDGAEPAASSVAAWNLLRLDALVPSAGDYKTKAIKTMEAFADQLVQHPQSMSFMASVVGTYQRGLKEVRK